MDKISTCLAYLIDVLNIFFVYVYDNKCQVPFVFTFFLLKRHIHLQITLYLWCNIVKKIFSSQKQMNLHYLRQKCLNIYEYIASQVPNRCYFVYIHWHVNILLLITFSSDSIRRFRLLAIIQHRQCGITDCLPARCYCTKSRTLHASLITDKLDSNGPYGIHYIGTTHAIEIMLIKSHLYPIYYSIRPTMQNDAAGRTIVHCCGRVCNRFLSGG